MLFSLKFSSYFSDTELSDLHDINMEGRINKIIIEGSEQWCTCQNCQSMPSAIENQCCQQIQFAPNWLVMLASLNQKNSRNFASMWIFLKSCCVLSMIAPEKKHQRILLTGKKIVTTKPALLLYMHINEWFIGMSTRVHQFSRLFTIKPLWQH